MQKGPKRIVDQSFYFYLFGMYIMLKIICENATSIIVKINFIWSHTISFYAASFAISLNASMLHVCSKFVSLDIRIQKIEL